MRDESQSWQPAPVRGLVLRNEVQIWRLSLADPHAWQEELTDALSPDELERAARFHFERDRRRFMSTRATLRALLGKALSIPPVEIRFQYGAEGKPALHAAHGSDLQFNVAHSHEMALLALARGPALGVDVEYARELDDAPRIAQRFFSQQEVAALLAQPAAQRHALFFRIWSRKEAFIKATGKGLSQPLSAFNVVTLSGEPLTYVELEGVVTSWRLWDLPVGREYGAALVVGGRQAGVSLYDHQR